jgi:hypothetical protein
VALKKRPFRTVKVLLKQHLSAEDIKTATLIRELRPARARGFLTQKNLTGYAVGNQHAPLASLSAVSRTAFIVFARQLCRIT